MSSEYESFHCNEQKLTESNGVYTTGNLSEIKNKGKKKIDSIKYKVFLFPYNHLSKHDSCPLTSSPSAQDKSSDTPLPTPSLQTPNSLHWHNSHVLKPTSHHITLP